MRKRLLYLILCFLMAFTVLSGCAGGNQSGYEDFEGGEEEIIKPDTAISRNTGKISYINYTGQVTGTDACVDTSVYDVFKTDLGIPFYDSESERLLFCFGDSYANDRWEGWNNNALLYTDNFDFSDGIRFTGALKGISTVRNGAWRRQITPDAYNEDNYTSGKVTRAYHPMTERNMSGRITATATGIPTGAIMLNGNYYMFYMEVTYEGFGDDGQWCVHSNRVMKSTDKGVTWTQLASLKWDYDTAPNFGQISPLEADGYIYLYGLRGGRANSTKLARVAKANFENMSEYEYYTGTSGGNPVFIKGAAGLAEVYKDLASSDVITAPCGEMSVMYNEYLGAYVASYQLGTTIVMRTAPQPYGPFSEQEVLFYSGEYGLSSMYCGFTNARLTTHGGRRMYFLMSVWWPDYNVRMLEVVFK